MGLLQHYIIDDNEQWPKTLKKEITLGLIGANKSDEVFFLSVQYMFPVRDMTT